MPRNAWYIGAPTTRLDKAPVPIVIHGLPVVLFRDADGHARALHDRCSHRGVALSLGTIADGMMACAYHGWRFDGEGRCRHIPSLRDDQRIRNTQIRSYPCVEQDGYIWLWTGDDEPGDRPLAIEKFDRFQWLQGAIELACEAILPIENNLDICHAAFTHPELHPQWFRAQAVGLVPTRYELDMSATNLTVRGPETLLSFDLPDRVTVGGGEGFRLILHHVPTIPGRCIQHWLLRREPVTEAEPPFWSTEEPEILAQDRLVLESAQRTYDAEGDAFERSVEADATTLAARRLLAAATRDPASATQMKRSVLVRS
ncbi:Rieske 2Fe-2S domain-containing protein [Novosphingopyxis sp.]|uniref:Rieske 2Fe-2S domain-containing protein n=1 Tax=Novosphingopyxis sp. TaxID=2709690 RepID=UPI003B58F301